MFGDYGHGSLIFFVGLILTLFNDRLKNTLSNNLLKMRYILLAMGACSMFNGLVYNEFFAIPNNWFGTCFDLTEREVNVKGGNTNFVYTPKLPAG